MFNQWRKQLALALMAVMVFGGSVAHAAAPPNLVTYQGRILNANSVPVSDASLSMKFFLYDALTSGTCLWSNSSADCDSDTPASTTNKTVTLTSGLFTQNLGDTGDSFAAIGDSVFADNASVYIEVIVDGETLTPRRRMTAAPYALNAQRLDGIDSTGFLSSTGDTGTGDYDLSGAELVGASPLVFEGGSNNGVTSTFAFTDPTVNRTLTFQNASGTVAFLSDVTGGVFEDGTNGVYEDDESVIVGIDAAHTYGSGGVGDLRVTDELEVISSAFLAADVVIGASTSSTETLSHSSFTLGGDDLFVAGTVGVEGAIYTDSGLVAGTTTTFGSSSITETGTSFIFDVGNTGSFTFRDGTNTLLSLADNGTTGDLTVTGDLTISGDDLTMGTNTSGYLLVADGTNFNPVALSGDISIDGTGATTIGSNSIALGTDTTGNYLATLADSGGSIFTITGSGSESAAATIAVAADSINFTELSDTLTLDASTSIALDGSEALTFTNGGTGNVVVNLSSTGDFVFQDAGTAEITITDGGKLQLEAASEGISMLNATTNAFAIADGSDITFQDISANSILTLEDVSGSSDHTIITDSDTALAFDSNADSDHDITTISNEALRVTAEGTGDIILGLDADTNFQIETSAVQGVDMLSISNSGNATTTLDANGIDLTFGASNATTSAFDITASFAGGASDGLEFAAFKIQDISPTNAAGTDTILGIDIQGITDPGSSITSYGIRLGSGYDAQLSLNDATSIIDVQDGGSLSFRDGSNVLMQIVDDGISGLIMVDSMQSQDNTELNITGGNSTSTDAGENVVVTGGTNDTSTVTGGNGGVVTISGGAAAGNGAVNRNGGDILIRSGSSTIGSGDAGNLRLVGGESTSGEAGDINLTTGGSPTAISTDGGDISVTAKDDITISTDDDIIFNVTSASAIANLFDNAVAKTIDIGGVDADGTDTINIGTNNTSADGIVIGNSHTSTTIALTGGDDWQITAAGVASFIFGTGGSYTNALCWDASGISEIQDCVGSVSADYAEMYPMANGIGYGDIVVPGSIEVTTTQGDTIAQLEKSSEAYQGPVVGIVVNNYGDFTSAGYNIEDEDNPLPVALVGRVPVKVVSEGGSISVGDYLTTSSTAGSAMRATKVGRVIGMALEDWDGVSATVMVQVNNSFSVGDIIGTDGTSTVLTDNIVVANLDTATSTDQTFDSYGLSMKGSAWNGSEAEVVEMMIANVVSATDDYGLSITNSTNTEVAHISNEGTMEIAGDMIVGGRLYPSDRGTAQTNKYIYYDGSTGAGGDMMRTNAMGWGAGSYDFAEMFPSNESLTAGQVVAFSGNEEFITQSNTAESQQLAGIVSTRPGFLAGRNEDGVYPVALAGRVPTFVSVQNGNINVGDPLTSSSTSGVAQKATQNGQIIGYALEAYNGTESDNLIQVFVNVGYWTGEEVTELPGTSNTASGFASGSTSNFSALNMSGNIYMGTHQVLGIGRLEGISDQWSIEEDGTVKTQALLTTITDSYQGTKVPTAAVTSPEVLITLTGSSVLVNGKAEIRFEKVVAEYNDVISAIAPIRVIVTPSGPVSLYVSEKDQNHFVVERFAGTADVEFDWMVSAYRKGYEPEEETEGAEEEILDETVITQTDVEPDTSDTEVDEEAEDEPTQADEEVVIDEEDEVIEEVLEEAIEEVALEEDPIEEEIIEETVVEDEPASALSVPENLYDLQDEDDGDAPVQEPSDT
jgi:hypothetical protein